MVGGGCLRLMGAVRGLGIGGLRGTGSCRYLLSASVDFCPLSFIVQE